MRQGFLILLEMRNLRLRGGVLSHLPFNKWLCCDPHTSSSALLLCVEDSGNYEIPWES